jgi:hypothetical protein
MKLSSLIFLFDPLYFVSGIRYNVPVPGSRERLLVVLHLHLPFSCPK